MKGDELFKLTIKLKKMSKNFKVKHRRLKNKEFISNMQEDIKTPLTLIKSYTTSIKEGLEDGTFENIIAEEMDNTSKILENFIDLSKIQISETKKELFYIGEFLDRVLEKLKSQIESNGLTLIKNYNGLEDEAVLADKGQLEICVHNIILNSIKYDNDNYIKIELNKIKDKTILSVKERCKNLSEIDLLKHSWKRFNIFEKIKTKYSSKSDMELAIVKEILKKNKLEYGISLNNKEVEFYIEF